MGASRSLLALVACALLYGGCSGPPSPSGLEGPSGDACFAALDRLGAQYQRVSLPVRHPRGAPELVCEVPDAVLLEPVVAGVSFRRSDEAQPRPMPMSCELAVHLARFAERLAEDDVDRVVHLGTVNCRPIAGTHRLSLHARGGAIDVAELDTRSGETYSVERDWPHDDPRGRWLRALARQLSSDGLFNIVLTPDYNAAHHNHLHLDITAGAHFLGMKQPVGWLEVVAAWLAFALLIAAALIVRRRRRQG